MKRLALFLVLVIAFAVWTFPHDLVIRRLLRTQFVGISDALAYHSVRPSVWPLGYRLRSVEFHNERMALTLDEIVLGPGITNGPWFSASACGGEMSGRTRRSTEQRGGNRKSYDLRVRFDHLDPSDCLNLGGIEISGDFSGDLVLNGLGTGSRQSLAALGKSGALTVSSPSGKIGGELPAVAAGAGSTARIARPIGQWNFSDADLRAAVHNGTVSFDESKAVAEGVEFVVDQSKLTNGPGNRMNIRGDFRARALDDSLRAKAVLGLLPKATEENSWRRYRVLGTLDAPRLIGLK